MAVQKPLSAFVELCWWPLVIFVYYLFTFSIFVDVSPDLGVGVHPPLGPLLYLMKSWARLEDLSPQLSPFWSRCCLARCLLVTPDKHSMFKQWLFGLFGLFGVYGVILVSISLPSGHIPKNVIYSQKQVHQVGCSNLQHDSFPNT